MPARGFGPAACPVPNDKRAQPFAKPFWWDCDENTDSGLCWNAARQYMEEHRNVCSIALGTE